MCSHLLLAVPMMLVPVFVFQWWHFQSRQSHRHQKHRRPLLIEFDCPLNGARN